MVLGPRPFKLFGQLRSCCLARGQERQFGSAQWHEWEMIDAVSAKSIAHYFREKADGLVAYTSRQPRIAANWRGTALFHCGFAPKSSRTSKVRWVYMYFSWNAVCISFSKKAKITSAEDRVSFRWQSASAAATRQLNDAFPTRDQLQFCRSIMCCVELVLCGSNDPPCEPIFQFTPKAPRFLVTCVPTWFVMAWIS